MKESITLAEVNNGTHFMSGRIVGLYTYLGKAWQYQNLQQILSICSNYSISWNYSSFVLLHQTTYTIY